MSACLHDADRGSGNVSGNLQAGAGEPRGLPTVAPGSGKSWGHKKKPLAATGSNMGNVMGVKKCLSRLGRGSALQQGFYVALNHG